MPNQLEVAVMGKLWNAIMGQINKLANFFWEADPIAQMQLEYDRSVVQLKEGRNGLEQYRGLVERVTRQVKMNEKTVADHTAKVKAYLQAGDRDTAGKFAIELKRAQDELSENKAQLNLHETAYQNSVRKIQNAAQKLADVKNKIQKYNAELKMSEAEAEVSRLAQNFNFDVTTDFGQLEGVIQDKIDLNRAKVRVAADMSGQGIAEIEAEERMQKAVADDLLNKFEVDMGLKTPETANVQAQSKTLGTDQASAQQKEDALKDFEKNLN
ncbi:MAG: PspA/IM30 family protein [Deltaproteobacteria bacterium]|nr:PspA/IM30 family protein [Deltaproteobacteria bacterium]